MSKKIKTNRAIAAFVRNLHASHKAQDAKKSLRTAKKILAVAEATSEKDWTPDMVDSINKAAEFVRRTTSAVVAAKSTKPVTAKKPITKKTSTKKPVDVIDVSDKTNIFVTMGTFTDTVVRVRAHHKVAGVVSDRMADAVRREVSAMLKEFGGVVASDKQHATAYYAIKIGGVTIKRMSISPRALDYVADRIKVAVKAELAEIKREFRAAKIEAEKKADVDAPVTRKRNAPARPARQLKSKPFGKSTKIAKKTAK